VNEGERSIPPFILPTEDANNVTRKARLIDPLVVFDECKSPMHSWRMYRSQNMPCLFSSAESALEDGPLEDVVLPDFDYNIAPSTFQPIIRADAETGERTLALMRWGLVPAKIADPESFKDLHDEQRPIRWHPRQADWKGPFQHSRCLIPVDGFYEWLQHPSLPQPPPIESGEHGLFGDIGVAPKKAAKPKAGSKPVYKFEMPDGAPYAPLVSSLSGARSGVVCIHRSIPSDTREIWI
jgi:hypothetical protein